MRIGHTEATDLQEMKKAVMSTSSSGATTQGKFGNDTIWGGERGGEGRMLLQGSVQRLAMSSARAWGEISPNRWCYSVPLWQGESLLLEIQVITVHVSPTNSQTSFFA